MTWRDPEEGGEDLQCKCLEKETGKNTPKSWKTIPRNRNHLNASARAAQSYRMAGQAKGQAKVQICREFLAGAGPVFLVSRWEVDRFLLVSRGGFDRLLRFLEGFDLPVQGTCIGVEQGPQPAKTKAKLYNEGFIAVVAPHACWSPCPLTRSASGTRSFSA